MKNEMDLLKIKEPERLCWLKANRVTLLFVGVVWIGIIIQQFLSGNPPWFFVAMVPIFALFRFIAYHYFKRKI